MPSEEPCGSLPVSGIVVSAHYCHLHFAWCAYVTEHLETGEHDLEVLRQESIRFGPFDTREEVLAWMVRALSVSDVFLP
jgi:hypothetical protein